MKLSLSVRVAETASKRDATHTFTQLTELAAELGYEAVCMRASQVGIHSPLEQITAARQQADSLNLKVSMVTGDFPVPPQQRTRTRWTPQYNPLSRFNRTAWCGPHPYCDEG